MMDSFWDLLWYTILVFAFVAYLIVLFHIISDLFRDRTISGWVRVLWIVFLVVAPYLTAFVYIVIRGRGMTERAHQAYTEAQRETDHYIRQVAGQSPAQHIAEAKALLDAGTITPAEFERLKERALGSTRPN